MSAIRRTSAGSTPEQVLAGEIARLSRELADLRSTVLARTSARASMVLLDPTGSAWAVTVTSAGVLQTNPA